MSDLESTGADMAATQNALLTQFARAYLEEQRKAKRWRWFWRFVWVGVAISMVWATIESVPSATAPVKAHTALVEIRGEIASETHLKMLAPKPWCCASTHLAAAPFKRVWSTMKSVD